MPVAFSPDSLRTSLQPLVAGQPLSREGLAYQHFYGLDFAQRTAPVRRQLGRFSAGGYDLVSQVWWPESTPVATLFLVHGFYDHMGLYRHVIEWGLNHGFVVIACDLPGHGLSSGERASIDDFSQYQEALQGLFIEAQSLALPQPWHLIGQSTGGAVVLDHLLRYGDKSPGPRTAVCRFRGWRDALLPACRIQEGFWYRPRHTHRHQQVTATGGNRQRLAQPLRAGGGAQQQQPEQHPGSRAMAAARLRRHGPGAFVR